jgi:hypothetical protein
MDPTPKQTVSPDFPLYSTRAIRFFSVLFSAVAGGILLAQNFKNVGRPDAARKALWGSIAYTLLVIAVTAALPEGMSGGSGIGLAVGLAGGFALSSYSETIIKGPYPAKSIWKPLLICILIFIPVVALIVYTAAE